MKTHIIPLIIGFLFIITNIFAQTTNTESKSWMVERQKTNSFIENRGQFQQRDLSQKPSTIRFAFDGNQEDFYFTDKGVVIELTHQEKRKKSDAEKAQREAKKKIGFASAEEFRAFEEVGHTLKIEKDDLFLNWLGANPKVQILAQKKDDFYHSYSYYNKEGECINENNLSSFQKITYKNLYPNIDVEYEIHPERGFKYSVIVHPGGDISQVRLEYSKTANLNVDGSISTQTKFGDMIDHKPLTFYNNSRSAVIKSSYQLQDNVISFKVGDYDKTKTIIIDPWTQTPNFPSSNWDCVWECERDGAGNVYIIGGTSPLQLIKYNQLGALQWTYNTPYDTTEWLGTFAVDLAGNSYVANGSPAKIFKVNTASGLVWNNTNPGGLLSLTEFWNITFNCDQTKLLIGGTDGSAFGGPEPWIFDINMNTGNVLASKKVHQGNGLSVTNAQEVRAVAACNNGKYYFLSHDSIGWIHQNLTSCNASTNTIFRINSGIDLSYKCENWRYNNTGLMALAHYNGFVFVHRGNQLQKRSFATGAIVGTVAIPGGTFTNGFGGNAVGCSGIDIDDCGNVFVGSTNGVYKFDQSLVQTGSYATTFNVYDVEVNLTGDVIAGGSTGNSGSGSRTGTIQSFATGACAPQAIVCCDATICPQASLCTNSPLTSLIVTTPGGTFSATCGACIDPVTGVFNPALAGVGTHVITYTLACGFETISITVNSCSSLAVCQESNGTLTVAGGTGPYTWSQWNPGGSTPITTQAQCLACNASYTWFFGSCLNGVIPVANCTTAAGYVTFGTGTNVALPIPVTYPVKVVDNAGTIFTISGPGMVPLCTSCPTLAVTPSAQVNVLCNGQSTGSFSILATGGAGPYDYVLMSGATPIDSFINVNGTQTFGNLAAGSYTINSTDANNCTGTTIVNITQPTQLVITLDSTKNASCGLNNGGVFITVSGGTPGYTYLWSNGTTTQDITGLAANSYQVTVTDNNGCTVVSNSIVISSATALNLVVDMVQNVLCNGAATGFINITTSGGTPAYTYLWSNNATTQDISGLIAGSYQVTMTDAAGCTLSSTSLTVTQPSLVVITVDSFNHATCGLNNGGVFVSVSGGTPSYTYLWNNGATTQDITGLAANSYVVTVTDANGCTMVSNAVIINNNSTLNLVVDAVQNVDCNNAATGYINVTASGGTPNYTYLWSNSATTGDISGLGIGTYQLTLTDASGCTLTSSVVTITQPSAITITVDNVTGSSCVANDGTISISVSGGTPTYTFLWSNSATTEDITGLAANTYQVTVTDNNGCTAVSNPIVVNSASGLNLVVDSIHQIACNGGTEGFINLTTSGGTAGYTYLWSNTATTEDISGLVAGSYQLTITDAMGCSITSAMMIITEPAMITIVLDSVNNTNCGLDNGTIDLTISGGTATYTYLWSNNATTEDLTGLAANSYQVTVTDANACTMVSNSILVNSNSLLALVVDTIQNVDCNNGATGYINVTTSGGTPIYTYNWSNNATTASISGLTAGQYQLTITDATGCTLTSSIITVTEPTALTLVVDNTTNIDCGASNGSVLTTASGGTPNYTYLWSNSSTTEDVTGLSTAGIYELTVTDNNGCTATVSATIGNNSGMTSTAVVTPISCFGGANGVIDVSVVGGTAPLSYLWSTSATTQDISGLSAGNYTVSITDAFGCFLQWDTTLVAPTALSLTLDAGNTVSCVGFSDGQLGATVGGGTPNYTYLWTTGETTTTVSGLAIGNYSLQITDMNGCTISATSSIADATALNLSITPITDTLDCDQNPIGALTALGSGGTGNFSYAWSNGGTDANATGLTAGSYTVTLTDSNGCTSTASASIYTLFVPTINPDINGTGLQNVIVTIGDTIQLSAGNNQTANGVSYTWSALGGNGGTFGFVNSNAPNTDALPSASAVYTLTITATSTDGCTVSDTLLVTVQGNFMGMPDAFSPNGDGSNDKFGPVGLTSSDILEFKVFNRWGQLIYDNKNIDFGGWDGLYMGVEQPSEVYIYLLRYKLLAQEEKVIRGEFMLLR